MAIQVLLCAGADWQKCNSFNESAFSLAQSKPACRMLIEDYKSSAQEKWLKEAKRILKQKYVGEEQILEDILFLAKPVTAEEIIQVTPPHFD